MKKSNSKFIQTKSRREIISANIDDLIDERNMTPTEFQEKMGMSKQDWLFPIVIDKNIILLYN